MKKVFRSIDRYLEESICVDFLSTIVVLLGFQVVGRYIIGFVSPVFEEVSRWIFVGLLYAGASLGAKRGIHFRVMVYKMVLKGRADTAVGLIGDGLWLGFNLFMVKVGIEFVESVFQKEYLSPALMFPMKYIYPIIPIGFLLIALRMVQFSLRNLFFSEKVEEHGSH